MSRSLTGHDGSRDPSDSRAMARDLCHRFSAAANAARALAAADNRRHARVRRQLGAAVDRRHRQIELRSFGASGQATRIGWNSALPFCPVRALTWLATARNARGRAAARPPAPRPAPRRPHAAPSALISSRIARRRAPSPRRSRTGTSGAPEPDRADRPTRSPSASTDARNSSPLGVGRHRQAGLAENGTDSSASRIGSASFR